MIFPMRVAVEAILRDAHQIGGNSSTEIGGTKGRRSEIDGPGQ